MPRVRVPVTVRWSDMDAFGHVNNVQVLRLLEEARVHAFEDLREDGRSLLDTGVLVARHEVEYLLPMVWRPQPAVVDLWVTAIGGASFDLGYELREADGAGDGTGDGGSGGRGGAVAVRASSTMVTFDVASGRTRRITDRERAVLEEWVDEPVAFRRRARA